MAEIGGATVLGPLLIGLQSPVQILQTGSQGTDIITLASVAAYELDRDHRDWAQTAAKEV
ncbi:MAG: hypothetical protein AAGA69_08695 [Pseudomonadota bacterium]